MRGFHKDSQHRLGSWCPFRARPAHFVTVNLIPALVIVCKPGQIAVEANRAAVADHCGPDARHAAAKDTTPHRRPLAWRLELDVDRGSRQQAVRRLDERTAGRDVDDGGIVPGSDACRRDAVIVDVAASRRLPTLGERGHSGFHLR